MDIFMRNIAYAASELEVKLALESLLHKPPFPPQRVNFEIKLFKKHGKAMGVGILTLPIKEVGEQFLRLYQEVVVRGRPIRFSPSTKPIDETLVKKLIAEPWKDPKVLEKEKKRLGDESTRIALQAYAFGRFSRDGSFSAEVPGPGKAYIACDLQNRQVRLTFDRGRPETTSSSDDSDPLGFIASLLASLSVESEVFASYAPTKIITLISPLESEGTHRIFMHAKAPPNFAKITTFVDRTDLERLPGLTKQAMPPGCRSLSLTFKSQADLYTFVERCRRLGVQNTKRSVIQHENMYSPEIISAMDQLMSEVQFGLAWEIEKAVSSSVLTPSEILSLKTNIATLDSNQKDDAARIFRKFVLSVEDATSTHKRFRRRKRRGPVIPVPSLAGRLDLAVREYFVDMAKAPRLLEPSRRITDGLFFSYQLILTPTAQILEGPMPDQSNNILRRFGHHDCFLRVSFQDENGSKLRRDEAAISELMKTRYRPILANGHRVAGRSYDFLGYSMSGLREHSVWFVTPFMGTNGARLNAEAIRSTMGDFSKLSHQPARLAARWSQLFSTTDATVRLRPKEVVQIDDRRSRRGAVMTDGCGTISLALAQEIWTIIKKRKRGASGSKTTPSAFQFRLGGCKGVVVVDNTLTGKAACFRPSQTKFDSTDLAFDVQSTSVRPKAMFLNRPLIVLLEYLGSSIERIISLQDDAIHEAQAIHSSFLNASKMFQQHGLGSSFHLPSLFNNLETILHLQVGNHRLDSGGLQDALIKRSLSCASTHVLRELKYRAHIAVPGSYTLLGVSDEWGCLQEGEIFATVCDERTGLYEEITGPVAITRSPQIHPGDVQMVTAVRRPQLEHLTNVVVFSCKGDRSLSSCLGGGDMDGDDFNLILDPALHPQRTETPGSYTPLPIKETDRPCGISDVIDFVFDYIEADLVGVIAISHLRFSDIDNPGSDSCLKLAECASHAVDFPKTGTPVKFGDLPKLLQKTKPDFLTREGTNPENCYPSDKLLGRLFRRVPLEEWFSESSDSNLGQFVRPALQQTLSRLQRYSAIHLSMEEPSEQLLVEMEYLMEAYSSQLSIIAHAHTIHKNKDIYIPEEELISGTIMANWSDHRKRREAVAAMNLQELVRAVRDTLRATDNDTIDDQDEDYDDVGYYVEEDYGDEAGTMINTFKRAWAAWRVAEDVLVEDNTVFGVQSFRLIALGRMLEIVKELQRKI
ncbi:RdRP-domain-containing protein [Hygrophoropsis aurantiaca]|uniref:RdRP-domain-containing protein n=1 Tax=Hygrophoropsis aurantiaca TaxID=72124 RepID=A0ACB8AT20_9AGAM|nr:RdRP-domain-containing protein [Hygrophoropsis aurantiaca]